VKPLDSATESPCSENVGDVPEKQCWRRSINPKSHVPPTEGHHTHVPLHQVHCNQQAHHSRHSASHLRLVGWYTRKEAAAAARRNLLILILILIRILILILILIRILILLILILVLILLLPLFLLSTLFSRHLLAHFPSSPFSPFLFFSSRFG